MFDKSLEYLNNFAIFVGVSSLLTYILPLLYKTIVYRQQNLQTKYNAKWAFVSGGSSGIGLSIVEKLSRQGINCIIAALDDALLASSEKMLRAKFPERQFKFLGVNLGATNPEEYMGVIRGECDDLEVGIVFNNAGYIQVGLFTQSSIASLMTNINCNAISAVNITHYFAGKMIANKSKGLISFTSSPGGFMGSPMASMYSSTKSFVTLFATSIAGELHDDGIDVTVVHPSPTNTGFYSNAGLLSALKFFQKTAVSPDDIADVLFKYAGRSVIVDHGYYTFMNRIALKILDITALTDLMWVFVKGQGDFKALKSDGLKKMANKTK